MPTVNSFDGLRVVIYPNDHPPAHVHVLGAGRQVIFELNCPVGPLVERASHGFSRRETSRIGVVLAGMVGELCWHWRRIHG